MHQSRQISSLRIVHAPKELRPKAAESSDDNFKRPRQVNLIRITLTTIVILHLLQTTGKVFALKFDPDTFNWPSVDATKALEKLNPVHNIFPDAFLDPVSYQTAVVVGDTRNFLDY